MLVARGLMEGILEPSAEIQEVMDDCLMCGYCQARCALDNMGIFSTIRQDLREAGFVSAKHERTATKILEEGTLFPRPTPFRRVGTTPLYLGCAYQSKPHEVKSIVSVLEKVGIDPLVSDEVCCSYIVGAVGFEDEFESAQARFRQVYGPHLDNEILTVCPTCTATLGDEYGLNVKHAVVAVAEKLQEMDLKPLNRRVTYHDPCHLGRATGGFDAPRMIMEAIPGLKLVEMPRNRENSLCCGAGGGGLWMEVDKDQRFAVLRVQEACDVGADVLATACPYCTVMFDDAVKVMGLSDKIIVADIAELLWQEVDGRAAQLG